MNVTAITQEIKMFNEIKAEILMLMGEFRFVCNLSLTFILAIACLVTLSDLQNHNTQVSEQPEIKNSPFSLLLR